MKYKHYLLAIFFSIFLGGCFGPVKTAPETSYMLNAIPNQISKRQSRPITLLVAQPETRPIYNTTRMAYTSKPYQVSYFGENQWAETPSQMLHPLLVQSLQNTHYFRAVVVPPYVGKYDYLLSAQILSLQQNFIHEPNMLEMSVNVQISRISTGQLVATKQFSISVPITKKTPYAGVIAANKASARIIEQITEFSLQNTH